MGAIGTRPQINKQNQEPPLLGGNVDDIIKSITDLGLIDNKGRVDIVEYVKQIDNINLVFDGELSSAQSGYLAKEGNKWIIGVNKKHNHKRQRFTIAHELAHFILHKGEEEYFEDEIFFRDNNLTSIEFAANNFAANILMPEASIRKSIAGGVTSLEDLADNYDVSVLAVKNTVLSLGYNLKNE